MNSAPAFHAISVVFPVYGCASCLAQLCQELENVLKTLTDHFEIILVDDRSPDNSWPIILALQKSHLSLKGIRLSRNFGQHLAITAGLAEARGEYVIVMDCDLQDPPSLIPDLYKKINEGCDLVIARRVERTHSVFRKFAAKLYFRLLSKLTEESVDGRYGSFSILSRKVVDSFLRFGERDRHYLFILRWLGFQIGNIDYSHQERYAGRSSYTIARLIKHAIAGFLFQSTVMLRWIVNLGFLSAFMGVIFAIFLIFRRLYHEALPGWTSLIVLILISTGVILVSQGMIGLYVGRIFDQTKKRPLYLVDLVSERALPW